MKNWRWRRLLGGAPWLRLILAAGILLAGGWPAAAMAAEAGPRMEVFETSHDFGKVYENQALSHTFVIKNSGNKPLRLEDVETDCACTVPSFDRVIPPGGQGAVTLTIKPTSTMRAFDKKATVALNDPAQPKLLLTLKGFVQPLIEIQPGHVVRLAGSVNDDLRGRVRFISHLPTPWEIKETKNNLPGTIEVNVLVEEPGRVYVLEVRNLRKEAGKYAGIVELITTSKERPRLIVRVFGALYPAGSEAR